MALLDALGEKLATDGVGVVGTSIFLSYMPDSPDSVVVIFEARGSGPQHTFGAGVLAFERPAIRVLCRAGRNDYPASRALALLVRASLGSIRKEVISGVNFMCVEPSSEPYPVRMDDKERSMFGIDFVSWINP